MEAFSRIKYVRFDGDNFDEVSSLLKNNKGNYGYNLKCCKQDVCVPEWQEQEVTVDALKIEMYDLVSEKVYKTIWCVQGNYVCLDGQDFDNLFILTHKEFVKKYEVEDKAPVTGTNFPFQDCSTCIYKKLYEYPKLPPTPSDPPYPWNQTQIWCKTQGETK